MNLAVGPAPGQHRRRPRRHQAQHIPQIVPGVGQQRHGVAEHPVHRLPHHEGAVQKRAYGEGAAERARRMAVRVPMSMMMATVPGQLAEAPRRLSMVVVVVVVVVVIRAGVIVGEVVRHRRRRSRRLNA